MPEISGHDIDEILRRVEGITLEIDNILSEFDNSDENDSEMLIKLYKERRKYLDILQVLYNNPDGRDFINKNTQLNWKKRINSVILKDKKQLDRIQNIIVELGSKLKNIVKQKSLLIYYK